MSNKVASELAAYATYARVVSAVLPVDEEADRLAARFMAEHHAKAAQGGRVIRKLTRKP